MRATGKPGTFALITGKPGTFAWIAVILALAFGAGWYVWKSLVTIQSALPMSTLFLERDLSVAWQDVARLDRALLAASLEPTPERLSDVATWLDLVFLRHRNNQSLYTTDFPSGMQSVSTRLSASLDEIDALMKEPPVDPVRLRAARDRISDILSDLKRVYDRSTEDSMLRLREQSSFIERFRRSMAVLLALIGGAAGAMVALLVKQRQSILWQKNTEAALRESERTLHERVADHEMAQYRLEEQGADLVRLAEDLKVARDGAKAADQAKSAFLATMSHELRTPLNAVIGFSEIIKDETFGPVGNFKYRDYAKDIHESGQHLLKLINDILDLSKVESGTEELHEDKIEIPEIICSALKLVGQRAEQGGVKLEIDIPDQLPALRADERKLKQILVNLLSNAVKFTHPGGEVTLRAWCRMDSGYVFKIVDTGIGIAPEDIPKALTRFGQVDGDLNRQYEGTGLGLPLTKALVEQHGGALDLQSEVSVGTTVTVRFPAERIVASLDNSESLDVEDRAAS